MKKYPIKGGEIKSPAERSEKPNLLNWSLGCEEPCGRDRRA
jgi:hypothetical protein